MTEDRGQMTEDRRQMTGDRRQRIEDRGQMACLRIHFDTANRMGRQVKTSIDTMILQLSRSYQRFRIPQYMV